jgi:DNA ligase-1
MDFSTLIREPNMAKQHFLMLAQTYDPERDGPSGWYMSEKLDGIRCFWDGGITAGIPKVDVPWANNDKDERLLEAEIATGLWSRYGNVIHAPTWWLEQLPPNVLLDGELYAGRGRWQFVSRTVKRIQPDDDWRSITYPVFGLPGIHEVFKTRHVKMTNMDVHIDFGACFEFIRKIGRKLYEPRVDQPFSATVVMMDRKIPECSIAFPLLQEKLPFRLAEASEAINKRLDEVTDAGGEGLILRSPFNIWVPERVKDMLKVKPCLDAEGTVIGYVAGKETDKGSRNLGRMGSLRLRHEGPLGPVDFDISGFSDAERCLNYSGNASESVIDFLSKRPGEVVPAHIESRLFPRGSRVTFKFREYSDDGIPKEARYYRKAD